MACVMRSTYLSFCPIMFSSPVEKERAEVLFVLFFLRVVFCVSSLFFFVASSITYLSALRFPYSEGVEGAFVLFFFVTYLSYLVPLLVAVPYRESVCLFVGGAGVGLHTMFFLCLVSVFLHLAALCMFVFSCAVRPLGAFRRIINILVRHTSIPLFPRGTWPSPIVRACACLRAGRCGV